MKQVLDKTLDTITEQKDESIYTSQAIKDELISKSELDPEQMKYLDLDDDTIGEDDDSYKSSCFSKYLGPIKAGSLRGAIFSLVSVTFGTGCLGFPYAIKCCGPIIGLILFITITIISYWTLKVLIDVGRRIKKLNYNDLVTRSMGNGMRIFADINNLLLCYGIIMAYQYVIAGFCKDLVKQIFDYEAEGSQSIFKFFQMFIFMIVFQIPLSLLKDISKLQYASIVGSFTLFYTILLVLIEMPFYLTQYLEKGKSIEWFPPISISYLDAFAIIGFGFSSHNGLFQIYYELKRPTLKRMYAVLNRSTVVLVVSYITIAYAGYFSTLEETPAVFIDRKDLPNYVDVPMIIGKILLIICLHCIMAIIYNILRTSFIYMWNDNKPFKLWTDVSICFAVYIVSNLMTFFINDITNIFNFIGGISTVVISTFNPIMIDVFMSGEAWSKPKVVFKLFICFLFGGLGVAATVKGFVDFVNQKINPPIV